MKIKPINENIIIKNDRQNKTPRGLIIEESNTLTWTVVSYSQEVDHQLEDRDIKIKEGSKIIIKQHSESLIKDDIYFVSIKNVIGFIN